MEEITYNIEQIKADIYRLYEECLVNTEPFHRKLDLFIVPEWLVEKVLNATSLDISNHWVCIDNFGIIHTLEQHGNPLSEARRGQVAIEKEDFVKFIEVLLYPDEIIAVGLTRRTNLPMIQFVKVLGNQKIVIKEVRTVTSQKKQKLSRIVFHYDV